MDYSSFVGRAAIPMRHGLTIGELALLEGRAHKAAAITLETSEVLEVPREEFMKRLNAADPVMKTVINHLVSRLKETTDKLRKRQAMGW